MDNNTEFFLLLYSAPATIDLSVWGCAFSRPLPPVCSCSTWRSPGDVAVFTPTCRTERRLIQYESPVRSMRHSRLVTSQARYRRHPGDPTSPGGSSHNNLVILGPNMTQGPATTSPSGFYHDNLMILGPTSPIVHNNLMMLGPYITQGSQPQHHPGVPATTSPRGPSHNITQGSQPQHHPGIPATTTL